MGSGRKPDFEPLLAPGAHVMTLEDVRLAVTANNTLPSHHRRCIVFQSLEQLVQDLLACCLRCDVFVNGSLVTEKPEPGDVDATVVVDADVWDSATCEQDQLILSLQGGQHLVGLDADAKVRYPIGHPHHASEYINLGARMGEIYGIENSEKWLKGYVVIPLGENDVGLRLRRR